MTSELMQEKTFGGRQSEYGIELKHVIATTSDVFANETRHKELQRDLNPAQCDPNARFPIHDALCVRPCTPSLGIDSEGDC